MECTHDILSSFQVEESAKRPAGINIPYVEIVRETHDRIKDRINSFLKNPNGKKSILLFGYAGCGKSTLLDKIAEEIKDGRVHIFKRALPKIENGHTYLIRDYGADLKQVKLSLMLKKIKHVLLIIGINYGEENSVKEKIKNAAVIVDIEEPYGKKVAQRILNKDVFVELIKSHKFTAYRCDKCDNPCKRYDFYKLIFEYIDKEIDGEKNVLNRLYYFYLHSFAVRSDVTDRLTPRYIIRWLVESAAFRENVHLIPSVDAIWDGKTTEDEFLDPDKKFNSIFIGGPSFETFLKFIVEGLKGPSGREFERLFLDGIKQYILVKFEQTTRLEKEKLPNELLIGAYSDKLTTFSERKFPLFYLDKRNLEFNVYTEIMEINVSYLFSNEDKIILRLPYDLFKCLYELAYGTVILSSDKKDDFLRKFLDDCLHQYAKHLGFDNTQHLLLSVAKALPQLDELRMATDKKEKIVDLSSLEANVNVFISNSLLKEYNQVKLSFIDFKGHYDGVGTRKKNIRKSIQAGSGRFRAFVASAYAYLGYRVNLKNCLVDWVTESIIENVWKEIKIPSHEKIKEANFTPEELAIIIGFKRMFTIYNRKTHFNRNLVIPNSLAEHVWAEDRLNTPIGTRDQYLYFLKDIDFLNKTNRFEEIKFSPIFLSATVKYSYSKIMSEVKFNYYKKILKEDFYIETIEDDDLKKRLAWIGLYEKKPDGKEIVKFGG